MATETTSGESRTKFEELCVFHGASVTVIGDLAETMVHERDIITSDGDGRFLLAAEGEDDCFGCRVHPEQVVIADLNPVDLRRFAEAAAYPREGQDVRVDPCFRSFDPEKLRSVLVTLCDKEGDLCVLVNLVEWRDALREALTGVSRTDAEAAAAAARKRSAVLYADSQYSDDGEPEVMQEAARELLVEAAAWDALSGGCAFPSDAVRVAQTERHSDYFGHQEAWAAHAAEWETTGATEAWAWMVAQVNDK